jgi:hypothetical protein
VAPGRYIYTWDDVPAKEQRRVLRLARQGSRHPDRKIAGVAQEWAEDTLQRESTTVSLLLSLVSGADAGFVVDVLRNRRRARRILRIRRG